MSYEGKYTEIPDWFPSDELTMEPGNDDLKEWEIGHKPPAQWRNWMDMGFYLALKAIDQALANHEAKKGDTHNTNGGYIAKTSNPEQFPKKEEIVGFKHGNDYHTEEVASKDWVMNNAYKQMFDMIHPVGDVVIRYDNKNPGNLSGWKGTWERIAENKMLIGQGSDPDFDSAGKTGGEKEHKLIEKEMPKHNHRYKKPHGKSTSGMGGSSAVSHYISSSTDTTGEGKPHNNMPPYEVVYIWRRVE